MTSRARARRSGPARPAVVAAAVLAALALAAGCGGGGGGGGDDDEAGSAGVDGGAQGLGAAVADAARESGEVSPGTTGESSGSSGSERAEGSAGGGEDEGGAGDLPPPTFPESSPPTTAEGTDPVSVPGAQGDDPIFGQIVVDLEPGGYLDLPTELRRGQEIQVLTSADDGIRSRTTVFAPDGRSIGQWESSGRPGDIEGYYWDDDDALPADGTYVFRVEHLGGAHNPFVLAFYGQK